MQQGLVGLAACFTHRQMPDVQLVTVDRELLGARELGGADWPRGSVIYTGAGELKVPLRVVRYG